MATDLTHIYQSLSKSLPLYEHFTDDPETIQYDFKNSTMSRYKKCLLIISSLLKETKFLPWERNFIGKVFSFPSDTFNYSQKEFRKYLHFTVLALDATFGPDDTQFYSITKMGDLIAPLKDNFMMEAKEKEQKAHEFINIILAMHDEDNRYPKHQHHRLFGTSVFHGGIYFDFVAIYWYMKLKEFILSHPPSTPMTPMTPMTPQTNNLMSSPDPYNGYNTNTYDDTDIFNPNSAFEADARSQIANQFIFSDNQRCINFHGHVTTYRWVIAAQGGSSRRGSGSGNGNGNSINDNNNNSSSPRKKSDCGCEILNGQLKIPTTSSSTTPEYKNCKIKVQGGQWVSPEELWKYI